MVRVVIVVAAWSSSQADRDGEPAHGDRRGPARSRARARASRRAMGLTPRHRSWAIARGQHHRVVTAIGVVAGVTAGLVVAPLADQRAGPGEGGIGWGIAAGSVPGDDRRPGRRRPGGRGSRRRSSSPPAPPTAQDLPAACRAAPGLHAAFLARGTRDFVTRVSWSGSPRSAGKDSAQAAAPESARAGPAAGKCLERDRSCRPARFRPGTSVPPTLGVSIGRPQTAITQRPVTSPP